MKFLLSNFIFLFAVCISLNAQEICDNGIDDDSDGLIDLWDSDCICGDIEPGEIEGDFEEIGCCPTMFTIGPGDGIYCLDDGWQLITGATADYVNICGYLGGNGIPEVPLPISSGDGAVGQITLSNGYTEYVGLCMECTFVIGEEYDISFDVGFTDGGGWLSSLDVEYAIYGTDDCDNITGMGLGCILDDSNWYEIETFDISGSSPGSWETYSGSFVASGPTEAIAIGPSCAWATSHGSEYHYLDNVVIDGDFLKESDLVDVELTGDCIAGVYLESEDDGNSVQWYLDGVAIDGATSNPFELDATMPGEYQVLVDYGGGECAVSLPVEVDVDLDVLQMMEAITNIECAGQENGQIQLMIDSPNTPFEYMWSNGGDASTLSDLAPGTYFVTVTDANGCFTTESYTIEEPPELMVDYLVIQPIGMDFGEVEIYPFGGTPDYQFLWSNGLDTDSNDELTPGMYWVIVTDANGCEQIIEFQIFEPFNVEVTSTDETCFDFCDGTISLEITGGALPYDIEWNPSQSGSELTELCPNVYFWTVTDAFGTQIFGEVEIEEVPEFYLLFDYPTIVCTEDELVDIDMDIEGGLEPYVILWSTGDNVEDLEDVPFDTYAVTVVDDSGCELYEVIYVDIAIPILIESFTSDLECSEGAEGFINLEVEGGEEPYEFDWSNGEDTQDIDDLLPGTYTVTVTDLNDCSAIEEITINSNSSLEVTSILDPVDCLGGMDGSIELMIEGGTMPYDIEWSTGDSEETIEGLPEGTYGLTVTDALNCVFTSVYDIQAVSDLQIESIVDSINCFGVDEGLISIDVDGGTTGLMFNWSNGEQSPINDSLSPGSYSLEIMDSLNCIYEYEFELLEPDTFVLSGIVLENDCFGDSLGQISLNLPNQIDYSVNWNTGSNEVILDSLKSGLYEVDVVDQFLCVQSYSFLITDPEQILPNAQLQNPDCLDSLGGSIILSPSGGDGNYTYLWSNGEVTDRIETLSAGTYSVSITDGRGCLIESSFTLIQEASIEIAVSIDSITCFNVNDGAIGFDIISGNSPFDISWSNGDIDQQNENLTAGTYYLNIVDGDNCVFQDSFVMTQPDEIVLTDEIIDPLCHGDTGMISVDASGGTGVLSFLWSNGDVGAQMEDDAGVYELMVEDENACQVMFDFELVEPGLLQIDLLDLNFPTQVGNDGNIIVEGNGGTGPFEYLWSNGEMTGDNSNLGFGAYSVTVTDANGCQEISVFDFDLNPLTVVVQAMDNLCSNDCDGVLSIEIANGLEPFEIEWSTGEQTDQIENLCTGNYSVTIQDGLDSMIVISNLEIISPTPFLINIQSSNESCLDLTDGIIQLDISGATPGYDIQWSNGEEGALLNNLAPGLYDAMIIDQNGCQIDTSITIEPFAAIDVDVTIEYKVCEEEGAIISFDFDDSHQVDFLINGNIINLDGEEQYEIFEAGNYDLSYQTSQNCEIDLMSFELEEVFTPSPVFTVPFQLTEFNEYVIITPDLTEFNDQDILVEWQSTNFSECQFLDQNDNCVSLSVLAEQSETLLLLIEDEDGCQYPFEYRLEVEVPDLVVVPNIFSPNNDGENDEFSIQLSPAVEEVNSFIIYDRWGSVVYELSNVTPQDYTAWDGRKNGASVSEGVFVFVLEIRAFDGVTYTFSGDLTLIR